MTSRRHSNESQKRGTATEHAKHSNESQKRGTATEHAKQPLVLERNPKTQQLMEEARADRADDSLEHLVSKLTDFLIHVMQMYPFLLRLETDCENIEDMLFDKISDWAQKLRENASYSYSELQLHKKIWDVVNRDKDGVPKEHSFVDWCRRIALHRTESTAANSAATELDDGFKKLVKDIFANDLTPAQKKSRKYKLREGTSITTKQRSFVNAILRTNLGDARVALYIFEHGIPTVLDAPLQRQPLQRAAMETMLEELMIWHACLLQWLVKRQDNPNTIIARKLSDLNQKEWQAERRHRKSELQQQLRQGTHLAELRDTKRKRFDDMSATEQRVLEDYDCGKLQRRLDDVRVRKPK